MKVIQSIDHSELGVMTFAAIKIGSNIFMFPFNTHKVSIARLIFGIQQTFQALEQVSADTGFTSLACEVGATHRHQLVLINFAVTFLGLATSIITLPLSDHQPLLLLYSSLLAWRRPISRTRFHPTTNTDLSFCVTLVVLSSQ